MNTWMCALEPLLDLKRLNLLVGLGDALQFSLTNRLLIAHIWVPQVVVFLQVSFAMYRLFLLKDSDGLWITNTKCLCPNGNNNTSVVVLGFYLKYVN